LVDRDVFALRLSRLETLLTDLRALARIDRDVFLRDHGLQAQAERWLQLAAEVCLDLANHLIATRGWPTPTTYREAFQSLGAHGVLSAELAEKMAGWAGLRNVLVHLYLDVDYAQIFTILEEDLGELEAYAAALTRELARAE
jgi:uncharacterized protein YutE (UPF0331/DUF86 family)